MKKTAVVLFVWQCFPARLNNSHTLRGAVLRFARTGYRVSREFLEKASEEVRPIHASGFFYVGLGYISYYLVFDYYDPLGYYDAIMRDQKLLEEEALRLQASMQELIDKEEVIVNGVRVRPKVVLVDFGFHGSKKYPFIVFGVRFKAPIWVGRNVYENRYDREEIEYDYEAYWIFPPGSRILEVDMGTGNEDWEVVGRNILAIYGRRGGVTGGYEKIVFSIGEELVYDRVRADAST